MAENKKATKTSDTGDYEQFMKDMENVFGKGSIVSMNDKPVEKIPVIPTGSLCLDEALGVGGYPRGRVVEVYGPESAGKSTLAIMAVAEAQKLGLRTLYVDMEHAINIEYARTLGVDIDNVQFAQPDYGEQALDIVQRFAESGLFGLIVVDSVAALVPKAELEGNMEDNNVGLQARLMSKALRRISPICEKNSCTVIFINQIREKVGVMYGNPETTTGGRALKFYSSVRIEVRTGDRLKEGSDVIGNIMKCKVVKNKVAVPYKNCELTLMFGKGISKDDEILKIAVARGIVIPSGNRYRYKEVSDFKSTFASLIKSTPELKEEILNDIQRSRENQ